MKRFWSAFIVSSILFFIAIYLGSYSYLKFNTPLVYPNISGGYHQKEKIKKNKKLDIVKEEFTSLEEAIEKSNRVNFMVLGMEDIRTDTIIFVSVDLDNKKVDGISIPRDTYIHRKGFDSAEQRKINAVYGDHGIEGVKKALTYILEGVPIHHYIMVDYEGVEKMVDAIGGVEVMVPFTMKYKDPTADPPLDIYIEEGRQILDGKKALDFLRYRKGNNKREGYIDGDLGRIRVQQQFIQSFVKKALTYRLPIIAKKGLEYTKTDIKITEALSYATKFAGMKVENFKLVTLPGVAEFKPFDGKLLSYFIYDPFETRKLLEEIYNVKNP
ncbi:LytR family transcriptional attenuator [Keratinibaculum paraultunense]|uniref:LytR family transcriptional attenuator n=1 Tax=Keratinibaculum paraultunense TaxID=1278232 RepID=A0A4R3KTU7_9FIRM|nr:LCP family protein [Keratinibaculum paraultunense]QQY79502.1 LCP family protein [Keratinibaculum paraultunense]TCS88003.1 LytR family transcriptional attenuator [Keratinibaculum paraultunense]